LSSQFQGLPYCGAAPLPAELWTSWNFDPWLVLALLLAALAFGWWQGRRPSLQETRLFATGWMLLFLLFVSPLCALTSALFAARVAHHLVMIGVAVPLLVLSLPCRAPLLPAGAAALLHALILWFWHAPMPYTAALASDLLFWLMQVTLFGTAWLFWQAVLAPRAASVGILLALLGTVVQMGLLGALITFAPEPLYPPHFLTTAPFGLSALEDQQLGGLIMWVPSILPYLIAALALMARSLRRRAEGGSASW
jgi:putative membrane protein